MRLIKVASYALLGYVLYELFTGMTQVVEEAAEEASGGSRGGRRGGGGGGKPARGGGRGGRSVETHDASGFSQKRNVGRGVVSRG